MCNIAMYGGAFDPPHNGHVNIAKAFAERLKPVKLYLIPTAQSPHKRGNGGATPEQRLEMCGLAMNCIPGVVVSDMGICRGGKSYTVDTLRTLRKMYPESGLYLLMGADMFMTLSEWHEYREILSLATICAVERGRFDMECLRNEAARLGARVLLENIGVCHVSSTLIRELLQSGKSVDGLLPPSVEEYIRAQGLYI